MPWLTHVKHLAFSILFVHALGQPLFWLHMTIHTFISVRNLATADAYSNPYKT